MAARNDKTVADPDSAAAETESSSNSGHVLTFPGAAVGIDDRPTPPLSAYEADHDRYAGEPSTGTIAAKPPGSFEFIHARDMVLRDSEFVVDGLLEVECIAAIFGKPGIGKSFIALDIACCVATETPYHGRAVRQGAVFYIAGEGHNGLKRRSMAWEKDHNASLADAPLFFSKRAANLLDAAAAEDVIAEIDHMARAEKAFPQLVIVDTVARNFGCGDENSTKDMNAFVAGVDSIKHRFPGCSVLLVHHTGHGDGDRARGSSVLIGALDAEYRVELVDGTTTLTCTKMKEGAIPAPLGFKAHTIEIRRTARDEAVTSLVFKEVVTPAKRAGCGRMTSAMKLALDTFMLAKRDAGNADDPSIGVQIDEWRKAFYSRHTGDTIDTKMKAFQRARKVLVEERYLVVTDDVYRLARAPEAKK